LLIKFAKEDAVIKNLSVFGLFLVLLLAMNLSVVLSQDSGPNIFVNGARIASAGAFVENGTTYVPLRMISEALGANVSWDGEANAVNINLDSAGGTNVAQLVGAISPSVVAIVGTSGGTTFAHQDRLTGGSGVIIRSGGDIRQLCE